MRAAPGLPAREDALDFFQSYPAAGIHAIAYACRISHDKHVSLLDFRLTEMKYSKDLIAPAWLPPVFQYTRTKR